MLFVVLFVLFAFVKSEANNTAKNKKDVETPLDYSPPSVFIIGAMKAGIIFSSIYKRKVYY